MRKYSVIRRRTRGGSLRSFFNKANEFLKKNKIISGLLHGYSRTPLPFASQAGMFSKAADLVGYGKRRRYGAALRAAGMRRGGMLTMAGR